MRNGVAPRTMKVDNWRRWRNWLTRWSQTPLSLGTCGFESHPPHEMRPGEDVARVRELATWGLNNSQIARLTGVSRPTVREWLLPESKRLATPTCSVCGHTPHEFEQLP